jgi:hypothetical protein
MKLILNLFGNLTIHHFPTKPDAIRYAITQSGLKPTSGHALCLKNYNYVNFPNNIGSAKIEE